MSGATDNGKDSQFAGMWLSLITNTQDASVDTAFEMEVSVEPVLSQRSRGRIRAGWLVYSYQCLETNSDVSSAVDGRLQVVSSSRCGC